MAASTRQRPSVSSSNRYQRRVAVSYSKKRLPEFSAGSHTREALLMVSTGSVTRACTRELGAREIVAGTGRSGLRCIPSWGRDSTAPQQRSAVSRCDSGAISRKAGVPYLSSAQSPWRRLVRLVPDAERRQVEAVDRVGYLAADAGGDEVGLGAAGDRRLRRTLGELTVESGVDAKARLAREAGCGSHPPPQAGIAEAAGPVCPGPELIVDEVGRIDVVGRPAPGRQVPLPVRPQDRAEEHLDRELLHLEVDPDRFHVRPQDLCVAGAARADARVENGVVVL